ncbi:hypothetical protein A6R68_05221, partial [Neotoma lepida]
VITVPTEFEAAHCRGRVASVHGHKAVMMKNIDNGTSDHPYSQWLELTTIPKVTAAKGKKKIAKKSKSKSFVKVVRVMQNPNSWCRDHPGSPSTFAPGNLSRYSAPTTRLPFVGPPDFFTQHQPSD